jgi:hypothetical protein
VASWDVKVPCRIDAAIEEAGGGKGRRLIPAGRPPALVGGWLEVFGLCTGGNPE